MKSLALCATILIFIATAFCFDFEMTIDAVCGPDDSLCIIGVHPDASNGIDGMDEISLDMGMDPPFVVHFLHDTAGLTLKLVKDIRSSLDSLHIFNGEASRAVGADVVLTWNPADVPADSCEMEIAAFGWDTEDTIWFDMTEVDSIIFPNSYNFRIVLHHDISAIEEDSLPPEILGYSIAEGETLADPMIPLIVTVTDDVSGVDTGTLEFILNGLDRALLVNDSITGDTAIFTYTPFLGYPENDTLIFSISDLNGNTTTDTLHFFYADTTDTIPPDTLNSITCWVTLGMSMDLAGSMVEIIELARSEITNEMGQCTFDSLESGTYTFKASREAYIPQDTLVDIDSSIILFFNLEPYETTGIEISGVVILEGVTGDLSGSIVTATMIGSDPVYDTTDVSGNYSIEIPMFGMYSIVAAHDGFFTDSVFAMFFNDTIINFSLLRDDKVTEPNAEKSQLQLYAVSSGNKIVLYCRNAWGIEVFDIMGKVIQKFPGGLEQIIPIDEIDLPSGVYYIRAIGVEERKTIRINITR